MNFHKKISLTIAFVLVSYAFFFIGMANAAKLNITANDSVITQDQSVQVNVLLDTQGSSVNTVQAEITFPANMFTLENISDGTSAVSLWIYPPRESSPGVIDLAGIIPGGFSGSNGQIFSFTLKPIATGTGNIQITTGTILANDGLGSPLSVTTSSVIMTISTANNPSIPTEPVLDYTAPNPFTPQIEHDPNIFNGKYFLVFSTTDVGSGIDHYEVLEVPSAASQGPFSSWHVATSPYLLTDQDLSSDIYVRAVDHDGNFIVVKIPATHPYAQWSQWRNIGIVTIILLMLLLFVWMRRRRA